MTASEIVKRKYQEGDEKALSLLLERVFQEKVGEEYWRWKYVRNPLGFHASYVALDGDRIISLAGAIPYQLKVADKVLLGGQLVDQLADPKRRQKGLFAIFASVSAMNREEVRRTMAFMYGFANKNSFRAFRRTLETCGTILRLNKVLSVRALSKWVQNRELLRITGRVLDPLIGLTSLYAFPVFPAGVLLGEVSRFDERFDLLWEETQHLFEIATVRDSRYLNWRYIDHPSIRYQIFSLEEGGGRVLGFIVLKYSEKGEIRRGYVIDLLAVPGRPEVVRALVSKSLAFFKQEGVAIITCWMFRHSPYYGILRRFGFFGRPTDLILMTKSSGEISDDTLKEVRRWYVTMGDDENM